MNLVQVQVNIKNHVIKTISNASDVRLNSITYAQELLNSNKISVPKILKENVAYKIEQHVARIGNMPSNYSYTPGNVYHVIHYQLPIEGTNEVLDNLVISINNVAYLQHKILHYKFYSQTPIEGNNTFMEKVVEQYNQYIDALQARIDEYAKLVSGFNESELEVLINQEIQLEIKRRAARNDALNKLNPFGK